MLLGARCNCRCGCGLAVHALTVIMTWMPPIVAGSGQPRDDPIINAREGPDGGYIGADQRLATRGGRDSPSCSPIVDGADDDWASWYAQWLIDLPELPDLLGTRSVRSELIYLLVSLDKQYPAEAPGGPWAICYGCQVLRHFQLSGN
jgi:hypothetical protein